MDTFDPDCYAPSLLYTDISPPPNHSMPEGGTRVLKGSLTPIWNFSTAMHLVSVLGTGLRLSLFSPTQRALVVNRCR